MSEPDPVDGCALVAGFVLVAVIVVLIAAAIGDHEQRLRTLERAQAAQKASK